MRRPVRTWKRCSSSICSLDEKTAMRVGSESSLTRRAPAQALGTVATIMGYFSRKTGEKRVAKDLRKSQTKAVDLLPTFVRRGLPVSVGPKRLPSDRLISLALAALRSLAAAGFVRELTGG